MNYANIHRNMMNSNAVDQVSLPEEEYAERGLTSVEKFPWAVMVGVDGSGKSTVLRRLQMRSDELPCKGVEVLHRRPGYVYQSQKSGNGEIQHYSKPNHGWIKSVLKIAAMTLDWQVGYWTYIRSRWSDGYFVIADRHSLLDMLADPDRYRYGGPASWVRMALKLVPAPPMIFYMHAPVKVLQARKQELNQERLLSLQKNYQDIFRNWPGSISIDSSQPVDEIVTDLLETLSKRLSIK